MSRGAGSGPYGDRCRRRTGRQEALVDDEVVRTFKEIDYDGDGYITAMEFKLAMTRRHEAVSGDEINSIFAHADDDGDGRINLAEFAKAWNS
nr:EF-hand domain-containing protein [Actinoallomurus spadix]